MKILFNILTIYLVTVISIYTQTVSINSDLSFYPIQTGNYFEYFSRHWEYPFYDDSSGTSITVLGDTILENGKQYKILLNHDIFEGYNSYSFERIDTFDGSVFRYKNKISLVNHEYKIDSLFAQPGDTISCGRDGTTSSDYYRTICISSYIDTIFGIETEIKNFFDQSFMPGFSYKLAKGFGFLNSYNCEFGCGSGSLVYAIIDGIEYGDRITSIKSQGNILPVSFEIYQNYPNPFNPTCKIVVEIPTRSEIELSVYNIQGELIRKMVNGEYAKGIYIFEFDGRNLSSGIYFAKLSSNNFSKSIKMEMLK